MSLKVWQFAGYHNSGKTTFITNLVKRLKEVGLKAAVIKHHGHHGTHLADPNTDTGKHWFAGADAVTYVDGATLSHLSKTPFQLAELIQFYENHGNVDVLLVEGFKHAAFNKVLFHRSADDDNLITTLKGIQMIITMDDPKRIGNKAGVQVYSNGAIDQAIEDLMTRIGV
ncbi:molybdopterin-guanine dinucleotide biosynthesis protein B [Scopulibacillus darangshiensis]|uniref:Molybdopterin-guanine dinucleotide biosynthesis protein B n=1 Tax=Scopulibacillus darangshiensis TaxID=442528 RepID=A0A4R2P6I2_9BACL|nr:molybdopterin-guanine dinucleotide biosynthesis protein B [Scopulibacillus darangshiensis]TCP29764.1 molybdopterin-guanine dinucleotide biosynthesis protein B [Scopulibacillus darangshiensis]